MTPQLQQAIRLLQLSALDLSQEIQEALDTNPLLDVEDEYAQAAQTEHERLNEERQTREAQQGNDLNNEREIQTDTAQIAEELPVDSEWTDVYDSYLPSNGGGGEATDSDYLAQRSGDHPRAARPHAVNLLQAPVVRGQLQLGQRFDFQFLVNVAGKFRPDPRNGLKNLFRVERATQAFELHPASRAQHLLDGQGD
jgi:hypothetical protein